MYSAVQSQTKTVSAYFLHAPPDTKAFYCIQRHIVHSLSLLVSPGLEYNMHMALLGRRDGLILQLLYVQWGPRNYEKCKMFRLIPFIMMSLNKFRFVAQVTTWATFFITIIEIIISIIGLICIMIQGKMLLLNQWLQKNDQYQTCVTFTKSTFDLLLILCLADKSFPSVRPSDRPSVVPSIHH